VNIGKSILDILWDELDSIVDRIMEEGAPEKWIDDNPEPNEVGVVAEWQAYGEQRGQAQGVAYAIALLTDPQDVSVPAVRAQAMQRWEDRQDDEPSDATKTRALLRPRRRHQRK
jgi:hypothetical protein